MTTNPAPTPAERARRFGETAIKTPANVVTLMRLLFAIPVLVWILDQRDGTWGTFVGWFVLSVTDGLDGWLARRDGTTRSGAFLDPLADKILVTGAFVALAVRGDIAWLPVIIVIAREGGIQVWRTLAGRRGISVPARRLGKWKAYFQFIAVGIVLFPPTEDAPHIYNAFIWFAVALSVVSAVDLILAARRSQPDPQATPTPVEPRQP
ncbi:MAG TPA: CDP-alcohol phosphatidyltransferase family protein [Acidimicrobiia bacterium]|nr:CDP-alcohol phosphatidyltransferase family protein [Acidimicrobiia bacterium]